MKTGNIIRTFHAIGNGWDFECTIRAADEQAYSEAKTYIRDQLDDGAGKARQSFLAHLREIQSTDH